MSASGSLAIVIPTGNARDDLANTLAAHCEQTSEAGIDVIVADNASDDGTAELVDQMARRYPCLRLIPHETRLDTAGHHVEATLKAIGHDYVWLFADADRPLPGAAAKMRQLLQAGHDLVLGRMRPIDARTGQILPDRAIARPPTPSEPTSVEDLARNFGFRSGLGCPSAVAFRRERFLAGGLARYRGLSDRHALGAAYLDAFAGARCALVSEALFDHRVVDIRTSARAERPVAEADPIGIVRLFGELRSRGKIARSLLFDVVERHPLRESHLWAEIVQDLLDAVDQALRTSDARDLPTAESLDEMVREVAISAPDLGKLDCARRLARLVGAARAGVQPFSASLDLAGAAGVTAATTLPYIRRLVDAQANAEIDGAVRAWITDEMRAIQAYAQGARPWA